MNRFALTHSVHRLTLLSLFTFGLASMESLCSQTAETAVVLELEAAPQEALILTLGESSEQRRRFFRSPTPDPIHAKLAEGTLAGYHPEENASLPGIEGSQWKKIELSAEGSTDQRGLYFYRSIDVDESTHLLLKTTGSETYVNGVPRCGNVYGYDYVELPITLQKGKNQILLRAGRKPLQAQLISPEAPVSLSPQDMTLPDLLAGDPVDTWGAVIVRNTSPETLSGHQLSLRGSGIDESPMACPDILPSSMRKIPFRIRGIAPEALGKLPTVLTLLDAQGGQCHAIDIDFSVIAPTETRRITFVSEIDGSVQYYALRHATSTSSQDPLPAIVLSCHGASVEARGQAAAYGPKRWFHIVAPTNRRPYGFDWEDFGRQDAMEVLRHAQSTLPNDPSRTYVTGHSMGGHGAWHLGVTYPDQFAAVGPSAGWISRSTYGRRRRSPEEEPSPLKQLIQRSENPSETLKLVHNLKHSAVYIVHGGDDNNVPASQAQRMADTLSEFHHDWYYHEEPGKNHWWSNEYGDNGSAGVDWPFMFDAFARHARPPAHTVRDVAFLTANPGISSRCHWLEILQQKQQAEISGVDLHLWPNKREIRGTTDNVASLRFDLDPMQTAEPVLLELDGQTLEAVTQPEDRQLFVRRDEAGQWQVIPRPGPEEKGPHRHGGPKDVLSRHFLLVYATGGSEAEQAWAFQKARFDAETFWYRGNASVDVIPDTQFDPAQERDRSVVLYGNAHNHGDWEALLGTSPVEIGQGKLRIGNRILEGEDLSVIFVRPRPGSNKASVVVISGTGLMGMRSLLRRTLFLPFVRFPDVLVERQGSPVAGGYFGNDWSVERGEFEFAAP